MKASDGKRKPDPSSDTEEYVEVFRQLCARPGMYVGEAQARFTTVAAWIDGFDRARSGGVLLGFREWLVVRAGGGNNFAWPALVWLLVDRSASWPPRGQRANRKAIDVSLALFEEFVAERTKLGLRRVLLDYQRWLWRQPWYDERSPDYVAPPQPRRASARKTSGARHSRG
jgi:hypothetical protein